MANARKLPSGKWIMQIRRKGNKPISKTFDTKLEADSWGVEMRKKFGGGHAITNHTLREAFERYAKEISVERKGERWEAVRLHAFCKYPFANMRLETVTTEVIQDWIAARSETVKGSTIRRELNLISAVFSACIKQWKWCSHNPVSNTRKPAKAQHRDRIMSDAERDAIIAALGYMEGQEVHSQQQFIAWSVLFALETAMRQGEIWGLQWKDVYINQRFVRLHDTKNGTRRDVPLSSRAVELLNMLDSERGGRVIPFPQASCAQIYRAAVRLCSIENLTYHDIRHTSITTLARKLQPLELARMVGHKNLNQLLTYYNEKPDAIAARLDAAH